MTSNTSSKRVKGFSLLEVLVAVVIMSVGLLALASLQLSMIRSSAYTKAQSVAAGLAKDRIESFRSFKTLDEYRLLTAPVAGTVEPPFVDNGGDLGGVTFTRTTKVSRFVYNKATGLFVAMTAAQNTLTDAALVALNNADGVTTPQYVLGKDFKRITVDVTWAGASGEPLRVSMEDILDSLDPTESGSLFSAVGGSLGPRRIEQKIANPALDAMVIPIAVGGGSESAASNPKPVVTAGRDTVETRFDILTYNGVSNGTATAQQKVETAVVGCTCTLASPPASTARGYRPTYWNGARYAVPAIVDTTGAGSYSPPAKADPASSQSSLCTACCRDHRDPVGVKGPAFSPRLVTKDVDDNVTGTTHTHYLANSTGTAWTVPVANGKFSDACRVIRVEGFWRVAADLENNHFKLLGTKDLSNASYYASSPVPDATATTNYQGFVIEYLDTRFTNNTVPTTYNTPPSVAALEATHQLVLPATIALGTGFTGVVVTRNVSGITQANAAVVTTSAAHTFANGDRVSMSGVGGMTALNGNSYIIANVTTTTFELVGVNSSTYPAYTSGGAATVNHGKWLHARGLFVDYLEKEAIAAIASAKTTCPSQTGSDYSDCVLKVLPFTSINQTEIADWASADSTKAAVTTNDFSDSSTRPDPVRGKVSIVAGAADGTHVIVSSSSRKSNTGLLDLTTNAISTTDNDQWNTSPAQDFIISNVSTPPSTGPDTFYVTLSHTPRTGLAVAYKTGASASAPCSGFNATKANYPCQVLNQTLPTAGLGVADTMAVEVIGYNSVTTLPGALIPNGASCSGPYGAKTYNSSTGFGGATTYIPNTCNIHTVSSATNTTTGQAASLITISNGGTQAAKALFNFALISGDPNTADTTYRDMISIIFNDAASTPQPMVCTYTCSQTNGAGNTAATDCKSENKTIIAASANCP